MLNSALLLTLFWLVKFFYLSRIFVEFFILPSFRCMFAFLRENLSLWDSLSRTFILIRLLYKYSILYTKGLLNEQLFRPSLIPASQFKSVNPNGDVIRQ